MSGRTARSDWEARIGRRSDAEAPIEVPQLPAPRGLRAAAGRLFTPDDDRTIGGEAERGRPPDPGGGTGHQGDPTGEWPWISHPGSDRRARSGSAC